jgi:hypothetical protein
MYNLDNPDSPWQANAGEPEPTYTDRDLERLLHLYGRLIASLGQDKELRDLLVMNPTLDGLRVSFCLFSRQTGVVVPVSTHILPRDPGPAES